MDKDYLTNLLFEKGRLKRIEKIELYAKKKYCMKINIYKGDLEEFILEEEEALSVRGIYRGRMGYSYTEKMLEKNLDELIQNLIQYAENNDNNQIEEIPTLHEEIKHRKKSDELKKYIQEEKINYLLDLEKKTYNADPRIKVVNKCSYKEEFQEIYIKNTTGLELQDSHSFGVIDLGVVAEEAGSMQTGSSHCVLNQMEEEYKDILIKESVGDALNMLGAKSIDPGRKEVILRNNVSADLFANFITIFNGSVVQKNLSLMKDKIGIKVSIVDLSIIEDPIRNDGKYCRVFDDEGTLTNKKYIIENGILKTFLHNTKTARKDGVQSTGNAFRESHKSSIGITPTSIYVEERESSLDDMIAIMNDGILITNIHGLYAGINTVSGDFSLSANGLLIESGQVVRSLSQITVAGNFFSMLKNIKCIGNDIKFCLPNSNYFGSPSIYVGLLSISGK